MADWIDTDGNGRVATVPTSSPAATPATRNAIDTTAPQPKPGPAQPASSRNYRAW